MLLLIGMLILTMVAKKGLEPEYRRLHNYRLKTSTKEQVSPRKGDIASCLMLMCGWLSLLASLLYIAVLSSAVSFVSFIHYGDDRTAAKRGSESARGTLKDINPYPGVYFRFLCGILFAWTGCRIIRTIFNDNRDLIRQLSAILIMLMGLFLLGIFKPQF